MVFRKKNSRKRTFKKRSYTKSKWNVASIAKTALKTAKFVAGIINAEYKYFVNGASLTAQDWNGGLSNMIYPSQGVGASQRTGDSIKIKDLIIRGEWTRNTAGLTSESCRLIIFIDKENSVSQGSDFLQTTGTYGAVYSEKNEDNRYKTKTLYDRTFDVNNYNRQSNKFKIVLKKLNHHIHFVNGTNTIKNNEIKMLLITQSPTNGSEFTYISRFSYVDN